MGYSEEENDCPFTFVGQEEEVDFSISDSIHPQKLKSKRIKIYDTENENKSKKDVSKSMKKDEEGKANDRATDWWKQYIDQEPTLEEISKMVKEVASTTSRKEKAVILEKHATCVKIHLYTNNPFWQYYVSSTRVRKTIYNVDIRSQFKNAQNIFHLLDMLKSREITGNIALATVCNFVTLNKKYENLIYTILDKNLKIRCGTATINSVFPELVPEFPVALAEKITDLPQGFIDYERDIWFALRKFDGVRVIAMVNNGQVEFRSREGNVFVTLQILENIINGFKLTEDIIFDGELCVFENDKEDFKKAVSEIKRKSGYISNPRYVIFDCLTPQEFKNKTSNRIYSERISNLKDLLQGKEYEPYLAIVECIPIMNEKHLEKLKETATKKEWEGILIRKDTGYEGKRSNNMVKIKQFSDAEFKCIDMTIGNMRFIVDGKDVEIETMRNITIDLDGNPVDVGSGFSLEERNLYKENPQLILDKIVCISYFETSTDKNGKPSLRFPTFKGLYGKKRKL